MQPKTILLISANRFRDPYPVYPLGVSYLKTYLDSHLEGFRAVIHDCNLDTDDDLIQTLRELSPTYIGISIRNIDGADSLREGNFMGWYTNLMGVVRSHTDAPVIIGGSAFSMFPVQFMEALGAEYGIMGEGEEILAELVLKLEGRESVNDIQGVVTRGADGVTVNPRRCYMSAPEVRFDTRLADFYWRHSGMMNIQTKRGCPFRCVYCSYPVIDGRTVRIMDPAKIVDDILRLKKDRGIDYYFFTDSVFNIGDEFNAELAERLIRSRAGIKWGAYFTPRNTDRGKMELYRDSGLTHVEFGTESLSDECLCAYGKHFSFDDVQKASDTCLELGIYYSHFLILGGYGETERTLRETMDNSRKLRHTVFFPFVGMRIYPETRLQEIAVAEGIIDKNDELLEPKYYISEGFDLAAARELAASTGKAWIFPGDLGEGVIETMRLKRNKKGPAWEYLRKP